jgi:hypothetical protein
MGARGPVPKRSDERVRRNKPDVEVEKVSAIGCVRAPELGFVDPHPMTVDLFASLSVSAQARFYEPSDYEMARSVLFFLDQQFKASRPSAQMVAALLAQLSDLLVTEGARRRVRLEVERSVSDAQVIDVAGMLRERLAAR